jgi:hypothetical protein
MGMMSNMLDNSAKMRHEMEQRLPGAINRLYERRIDLSERGLKLIALSLSIKLSDR